MAFEGASLDQILQPVRTPVPGPAPLSLRDNVFDPTRVPFKTRAWAEELGSCLECFHGGETVDVFAIALTRGRKGKQPRFHG